jgi:hypothetical protein
MEEELMLKIVISAALLSFPGVVMAEDGTVEKICQSVITTKNPNRAVICEVWKLQKQQTERSGSVVKIEDPDLDAFSCGSGNDPCTLVQATVQCTRRGFSSVQYFTSRSPSGGGQSRNAYFTALYCKT